MKSIAKILEHKVYTEGRLVKSHRFGHGPALDGSAHRFIPGKEGLQALSSADRPRATLQALQGMLRIQDKNLPTLEFAPLIGCDIQDSPLFGGISMVHNFLILGQCQTQSAKVLDLP